MDLFYYTIIFWSSAGVFVLAMLFTWLLASERTPLKILDKPNERSLHDRLISRTGGIGILLSLLLFWFLGLQTGNFPAGVHYGVPVLVLVLAAVSLVDDLVNLSIVLRLLVHCAAAYLFVFHFLQFPDSWLLKVLACVGVVWMINLYNFMDGMDGFAGGMGVLGFSFLGLAGLQAGDGLFVLVSFAIAAANLGFLVWNFPPARIFLGDVGSISMGFLAAILSLWGMKEQLFPVWYPVLVFSPFICDATFTLMRRILVGERFWQAHRSHIYQKLVQMGLGHRKTVLIEYIVMILVGLSALFLLRADKKIVIFLLSVWAFLFIFLFFKVLRLYNQANKDIIIG